MDILAIFKAPIKGASNSWKLEKDQYILTPAAKKRTFWGFFKPQLQVQVTAKRYDQYYNCQGSIYINPCSQKTDILANFQDPITDTSIY